MRKQELQTTFYFEQNPRDYLSFCTVLKEMSSRLDGTRSPAFLCIGTDRMTGDCLGPLIGHQLNQYFQGTFPVFGTLEYPVHALNLRQAIRKIQAQYPDSFLIAVDAALGRPEHIGSIALSFGSLTPGEGMRKQLPSVGEIAITGIVNQCSDNADLLLQNTRLHLVHQMAEFISSGLIHCFF